MAEEVFIDPECTIMVDPSTRRGEILINNHSMTGKGFKIKTTKPDDYTVKPNLGIIHPLQKESIEIIVEPKTLISNDHKFLIEIHNFEWQKGNEKFREYINEKKPVPLIKKMLGIKMNEKGIKELNFKVKKYLEKGCLFIILLQFLLLFIKMLS
ncbi:inositol metabolism VAMP-associated [Tubulinosema ratisbonensis]|uniref:Inositol metabolism VAMP-associated n=1 Tax=Tubulinosema ratisbonensis TaxID=291195 RepID=A0A437AMI3_9MICR|nr:inositol metabolism VAMP-associated [Tubulinosema ratisbonensis]